MSSVPARPSTHHKTSRRGLLSLGESGGGGFSIRGGNGAGSSASLPSSGLPPRPSTRGDGSTPLRRPGPLGFTGAGSAPPGSSSSGAAQSSAVPVGSSSQLPRVSTPGRASSSGRPPMWGHGGGAQSAPTTPLQPNGRAATAVGPSGVPRPSTHQQGRHRRTHSSDASAPTAAAATTAAAALKRPSSQQASRSTRSASTPNRPGSMGGQDFHRGLVSALQDVLRQQRQGVFPTVTSDGIEMSRGASRPGTSAGSEQPTSGAGGSPAGTRTTSTPLGGAGGRWGFTPMQEADDEDPFPTRPSASQSRSRRATPAAPATGPPGAPWVDEAEDVLLSAAALQMLRNVERSEGIERRNLNALADSGWDALMARETSEVVEAAHRPTMGRASSNSRPPSSSAVRPGTGANRAMPGTRVASASLSGGHARKTGGAQLRAKRHSSGNASLDTSAESIHSNPGDGGASSCGDVAALKAQGNEHYSQRRFLAAHRSYSLAMEADPSNTVLLSNRAATHTMLLNYDACVRDCLRATSLDPRNWKAYSRMARAHAMLGQYPVAARHFTTALVLLEDTLRNGGPSSFAAQAEVVKTERGELQHLERARLESDVGNTQAAAGLYSKAASFVDEAPIRLHRLGCVLQFSPASARAELTKYLSTLEHPSTYATSADAAASVTPSSGEGSAQSEALPLPPSSLMMLVPKLLLSKAQHYCAVLVTLAKASLYCGVHYLNIAASHLQQCIAIRSDYPGAQAMLTQLTTFEDRLAAATELADAESHADAVTAFTEALDATHDTNTKVRGLVLVQRAESYLKVSMPKPALEDCTVALGYDGNNLKALTKRARAHESLGDLKAALLDLEHAATINEELAEAVVALRMRMQQQHHHQQQQRQQSSTSGGGYFGGSRPGTGTGGRPGTGASYGQRPGTSQQSARPVATHYATLGVAADADSGTIRTAYRKLTLQLHPDKLVKEVEEVRQRCELRFKEVSHAYSVLSDPVQRMQYDLSLP